jgi:outer membrane protein assembly factor BamB
MQRKLALLSAVGVVLSLSIGIASVFGDWPQWRGPNRDGHSADTGLLKKWPDGGPKLEWKATGLGAGYTSVSVVGNRLFAMGDLGDSNFLIAIDGKNGQILWKTKVGKAGAPGWGGFAGPRCTPTVDGDLVFAVGQYGEVLCADTATGAEVWRKDYIKDFGAKLPEWGFSGMPLVDGEKLIMAPGGEEGDLVALEKKTGSLIWRSKDLADGIHYSSPILVEIGGVRQIIQLTDAHVAGIRVTDGELLWQAERKGSTAVIPTPIYHDGKVYVTSGYGAGCNLFAVSEDNGKFSATQSYANKLMLNHHGGVVLVDKHLYGFSDGKGWTCQDFETGKDVWRKQGKLGKGSLVYADGLLYLRAEDGSGTVALIEATPDGYKEVSRFDPPDRSEKNSWPHPVVTGGRLYLRDQDVLQCYDVKGE